MYVASRVLKWEEEREEKKQEKGFLGLFIIKISSA